MKRYVILFGIYLLISGCGKTVKTSNNLADKTPPVYTPGGPMGHAVSSYYVKASAEIPLSVDTSSDTARYLVSHGKKRVKIRVKVKRFIDFVTDDTGFIVPEIDLAELSFGVLKVNGLLDNTLSVCGDSGNEKCTEARIILYTKADGAGLYNPNEKYGLPMSSSDNIIGVEQSAAVVLGSYAIPEHKRVIRLKDILGNNDSLEIPVSVNFTDAGAGTFATTLVLEYVLL